MTSLYGTTREELHRIATHVLARARWSATGRFGLRVVPDGIATPAFGDAGEVLRLTPSALLRERQTEGGARTEALALEGRSLAELARFAGVDLVEGFSVGRDPPPIGDPDSVVTVEPEAAAGAFRWFALGARALDVVVASCGEASVVQLWPEHFDMAVDVKAGSDRVNLGASAGDGFHDRPYLYVGPWGAERPGDPGFWNAPFGAVLGAESFVGRPDDGSDGAVAFLQRGLELLR